MAENLIRLGVALTEREKAMLDEIVASRHKEGFRVHSMTVRELIREEYERMHEREKEATGR